MADDRATLEKGELIAGYAVVRCLGSGAAGNVYLAAHQELEDTVAIREYLPRGLATRDEDGRVRALFPGGEARFESGRARCQARAEAFLGVEHPNLARIREVVEERGTVYVVMDYARGTPLSASLGRGETVGEDDLAAWFVPVADALLALHDVDLVHGNFGLGTVVADEGTFKLLGLAVPPQDEFGVVAKPGHAPLESYSGHAVPSDTRADVYSLATVLYRCVTGVTPPEAPVRADRDTLTPAARAARGRYRPGVLAAIDAALALQPDDRPDMATLREALASIVEDPATPSEDDEQDTTVKVSGRVAMAQPRPAQRPKGRTAVVAGSVVLVAVIGGVLAMLVIDDADTVPAERVTAADPPAEADDGLADPEPPREAVDGLATVVPAAEADDSDPATDAPTDVVSAPPSATPETARLGELAVDTTPPGAEVLLDGVVMGETPLRLTDVDVGDYTVTLRHSDFDTEESPVTVSSTPTRIERTLVRATGSLLVSTTPSAWVEVDGERLADATPATLELPTGSVTLDLGAAGHDPVAVEARVRKGETATVDVALTRRLGALTLTLMPRDADVVLPDADVAYAPGMSLPEGPHRVEVSRPGHTPFSGVVDVEGDTEFDVVLEVLPQPFTVTTSPPNAVVALEDIDTPYLPGQPIAAGAYTVEVTLPGYAPWSGTVRHGNAPTTAAVSLEFVGAEYADVLASGGDGPPMTVIPAGSTRLGCRHPSSCRASELPVHDVTFRVPFAMSKHEVTFEDYDRFARASGRDLPDDFGWRRGNRPAINVTWSDADAYAAWLSRETGRAYRLPSEAEWEYAARGDLDAAYGWGDSIIGEANCGDCSRTGGRRTMPAGSYRANAWGLHDMHGNVWEWVRDCWNNSHDGVQGDGSARLSGDCEQRVLRGGSWFENATFSRAAARLRGRPESRANIVGFRVVAELGAGN